MLGHPHRDRWQLRQLMAPRLNRANTLCLDQQVRTQPAALRPMLDDLVDLPRRKQPPVPAFMPRLTASPPTRPLPTRTRRRRRKVLRRRQRRVSRTSIQPPLELGHPSLKPLVRLDQLAHPQQQRHSRLTITIQDRLRLGPLHASRFAASPTDPVTRVNAYQKKPISRAFTGATGLEPATSGVTGHFQGHNG
jgi:hypothetical protein